MKQIKIEKITLNIGTGGPGEKLEKGMKLLKSITEYSSCKPNDSHIGEEVSDVYNWTAIAPKFSIATVYIRGIIVATLIPRVKPNSQLKNVVDAEVAIWLYFILLISALLKAKL